MLINTILAIFAFVTKCLTFRGIVLAFVLGIIVYYLCVEAYIVLFLYFVLISVIEKIVLKNKKEKRSCWQVLSNFAFAFIALILYVVQEQHRYIVLYCSMLSVSLCDTLASTLGTQYAKNVYSIIKFKKCEKGMSGGISFCGSISGTLGSMAMALMYYLLFPLRFTLPAIRNMFLIVLLGVFGMLIDSILGDFAQKKYFCSQCKKRTDNDMCCGKACTPIGAQLLTNSQVNIISEGLIFVLGLLII